MAPTYHRVDQHSILLDQTERRPVMFDSVMALVRARHLYCDGLAFSAGERRRAEHQRTVEHVMITQGGRVERLHRQYARYAAGG